MNMMMPLPPIVSRKKRIDACGSSFSRCGSSAVEGAGLIFAPCVAIYRSVAICFNATCFAAGRRLRKVLCHAGAQWF